MARALFSLLLACWRLPERACHRARFELVRLARGLRGEPRIKALAIADDCGVGPPPRRELVDIVVAVHDALDATIVCLESIVGRTSPPYHLIIVDDGSQPPTRDYLASFATSQAATLIRHERARGYTVSINRALAARKGEAVVLLNSDTEVTTGWLDRLLECARSDPRIGLAGPLSNTASWQSIPAVFDRHGDWARNPLPAGWSIADQSRWLAEHSGRCYPRLPVLNGFCLLVTGAALEALGPFDEEAFPQGYGEETDYCMRARRSGFELAVADDAYVFHAQSRSFSDERRHELVERSDLLLAQRYGSGVMSEVARACRDDLVLHGVRARAAQAADRERLVRAGLERFEGKRLLFLLPVAEPGGGAHVVMQEAEAMARMGVDVRICALARFENEFRTAFPPPIPATVFIREPDELERLASRFDAVVATVCHSVAWLAAVPAAVRRAYYVQDFEPLFFPPDSPGSRVALASYTLFDDLVRITKSRWNADKVLEATGAECHVVGPSVDVDRFQPLQRRPGVVRVAAMVRPSTPRRQPGLTLRVLRELARDLAGQVEIVTFGCPADDPEFLRDCRGLELNHAGVITRRKLARLLATVDIFADFSEYQAMGLTALEAMAAGASVVVPVAGGAGEFARDGRTAVAVDTRSEAACLGALAGLARDRRGREALAREGMSEAVRHHPERAAYRFLEALFGEGS